MFLQQKFISKFEFRIPSRKKLMSHAGHSVNDEVQKRILKFKKSVNFRIISLIKKLF